MNKICSECKEELPATTEYFYKDKNGLCGLRSKCKKCQKQYRTNNKEKLTKSKAEYYKKNKEKIEEHKRLYRLKNKQKVKKWHKNARNKDEKLYLEKRREYSHRRRAKLSSAIITLTQEEWEDCLIYFNNSCAYCGLKDKLTKDHVTPISKYGNHSKDNIVPACEHCNFSKQDFDFHEWFVKQEYYSRDRENKIIEYMSS